MGSQQQKLPNPMCNICHNRVKCSQCFYDNCLPQGIKKCQDKQCKDKRIANHLQNFQSFKQIMKGTIISFSCFYTKASSRIPFINSQIIYHCYCLLTVEGKYRTFKVKIEGERGKDIKMLISISENQPTIKWQIIKETAITEKSFKQFYLKAENEWRVQRFQCYTNNCFHLANKIIMFLKPDASAAFLKPLWDKKDEQYSNYWGE